MKMDSMQNPHFRQFFIDGRWVDPVTSGLILVIDPSTEKAFADISGGSSADIDLAVRAAKRAFPAYAATSREERLALLRRILEIYRRRYDEFAEIMSREVGTPLEKSRTGQ